RYVNRKQYLVFVTLLFALTGLCAFVWSNEVNEKFLTYAEYNPNFRNLATLEPLADYDLQKQALLQSPLKLPVILFHALTDDPAFYLKTYIGQFGTYLDTSMSNALFCFVCIGLVLLSFFDTNAHVPGWGLKFRWMFIAFVTYSLVILSQYLTWNPVGSVKVVPIQGRYLVPILPFVFILFMRRSESSPFQKSLIPLFTILLLVFAQVSVVQLLTQRYFSNNSMELISFCENFESPRKNIAGSEVECKAYQKLINSEEQLNGTHSLKLDSSLKAISILTLDTIRRGDFLHIEVWCKGGNGYVQLKGDSGAVCKSVDLRAGPSDFYIKNGWRKIRMVMSDGLECDGQSVRLLLANDSQGTVYFDSLTCVVRRFSSTN
ncbi:MAG TPA: DUF2142 domain-containing protein, partial [Bacteroidia bacterium]|nr:DUF2142 domain-containing protein [Bacteroidia bacterium]